MVEWVNIVAQIFIFIIGIALILNEIWLDYRKPSFENRKRLSIINYTLGLLLIISGIVTWRCTAILEKRNSETIKVLEENVDKIKPRLKILKIYPSPSQEWPGQLTIKVGSDANQKIDRLRFEIVFENPYIDAKYNYSWDLPSKKGTKYFEPITMATNSKKFVYESEEPLPPGFFLHFIFTSELPLIIESTNLSP
jgi:hypothetical protein